MIIFTFNGSRKLFAVFSWLNLSDKIIDTASQFSSER